ncbi:MAG: hypothetical protein II511_03850 [Bacteroidales bacterium]|nr:hypothetical protein [Bacteroidales bacterium]
MKKTLFLAALAAFALILGSCGSDSYKITGKMGLSGTIEDQNENEVGDSEDYFEIRGMSFNLNKAKGLYEISLFIDNTQNISDEYELVKVDDLHLTLCEKDVKESFKEFLEGKDGNNKSFRFECVNKDDFGTTFRGYNNIAHKLRFEYAPDDSFNPEEMKYLMVDLDLIVKKKASSSLSSSLSSVLDEDEADTDLEDHVGSKKKDPSKVDKLLDDMEKAVAKYEKESKEDGLLGAALGSADLMESIEKLEKELENYEMSTSQTTKYTKLTARIAKAGLNSLL